MLGAIIGDIAGSFREFTGKEKYENLPLMPDISQIPKKKGSNEPRYGITDDSLLSIATAVCVMGNDVGIQPYKDRYSYAYHKMGNKYSDPIGGFGAGFNKWLSESDENIKPYNSCGNGSAMRVSPIGWAYDTMEETLEAAFESALPTHNHPEGIKGAQATAAMIFMAREGKSIDDILEELNQMYLGYEPIDSLGYFDATCPDTMRLVVHVLGNTSSFEDAVFKAVTIPYADADTLGAIVGSVAEALYGIPDDLEQLALDMIKQPELRTAVNTFREKYCSMKKS